jgi:hypothetical protein
MIMKVLGLERRDKMILIDLTGVRRKIIAVLAFVLIAVCLYATFSAVEVWNSSTPDKVSYKDYTGCEGKFTYKLLADWKTKEQKFEGNEILYHNDFISSDNKILGYVQVWNLGMPLKDFIEQGKKSASELVNFKEYSMEPVKIGGKDGYILQYTREVENGKYIKAFEVFVIDKGNIFHRFAFYMDEKTWKNDFRMTFLNIAATGNYK